MIDDKTLLVPALGTYGISGGQVNPKYWREIAIPELESRYLAAK